VLAGLEQGVGGMIVCWMARQPLGVVDNIVLGPGREE
jgi:hypothetical protein